MFDIKRVDSQNNETVKSLSWEQLKALGLEKKDKRIIDENLGFKISFLVGRDKFILIKLDYLRCLLFADHLDLFISLCHQTRERLDQFVYDLKIAISSGQKEGKPFILTVLEEIFHHVHNSFIIHINTIRPEVKKMNNNSINNNTVDKSRVFKVQKDHLQLHYKIKDIYELLHEFSSEKDENRIDELIIEKNIKGQLFDLIDNYASYYEELVEELDQMDELINYMIKLVNIGVSETRNSLARIATFLSIVSIAISTGNLVLSSFGMNFRNGLDYRFSFLVVNIIVATIIFSIAIIGCMLFKQFK